jgi:hypothetical protein
MSRSTVAAQTEINGKLVTVAADSVLELAGKIGTSRTNLSDAINGRDGRVGVNAGGHYWIAA